VHVARHFVAFTSDVILNKKKLGGRSNLRAHSSFLLDAFRDWKDFQSRRGQTSSMTREQMLDAASIHSATSSQNDVFAIDDTFVPPQAQKLADTTQSSFGGLVDPPLLLYEDLKDGCGGQLWPAGMVLSKYMLTHHKTDLAGKAM
jgi:hypothetical protein